MQLSKHLQVPHNFDVCSSDDCPKASTCLRRFALEQAADDSVLRHSSNYGQQVALGEACEHYCSTAKVRYAKGISNLTESLSVHVCKTFRWSLIFQFGRKKYYQLLRGEVLITPSEQEYIIRQAKDVGLKLDKYFDEYLDDYDWKH